MKKWVLVGCLVLIFIFVGCVGGIALLFKKGKVAHDEAVGYGTAAVSAIATNWDIEELRKRESPEFKAATTDAKLEKMFKTFRTLGKLVSFHGNVTHISSHIGLDGKVTTIVFVADARFQNGPAQITLTLFKRGGQWQIAGFRVDSNAFMDMLANMKSSESESTSTTATLGNR